MTNASEKRAPLGTLRALLSILLAIAVLVAAQTLALLLGEILLGAGVPGPACNVLTAVLYVLFALGGAALGTNIAAGGAASAHIAIGDAVDGAVTFSTHGGAEIAKSTLQNAILQEFPSIPRWILRIFTAFAS